MLATALALLASIGAPSAHADRGALIDYFRACNVHIVNTLKDWKLDYDAGERPTPLMMLGLPTGTSGPSTEDLSTTEKGTVYNDTHLPDFLDDTYVQAMINTETAYIRLIYQYETTEVTAEQITNTVCSAGRGCTAKTQPIIRKTAQELIDRLRARNLPIYSVDTATSEINAQLSHINGILAEQKLGMNQKPAPTHLAAYQQAFFAMVRNDGPIRLLAVPSMMETVGRPYDIYKNRGLETISMEARRPGAAPIPARLSNSYAQDYLAQGGGLYSIQPYKMFYPHSLVTSADVTKAIRNGKVLLEKLFADLNYASSSEVGGDWVKMQAATSDLMRGNSLAVLSVLEKHPEYAPSACRAFTGFAISTAATKRSQRYRENVMNGLAVVAAFAFVPVAYMAPAYLVYVYSAGALYGAWAMAEKWAATAPEDARITLNASEVTAGNESPDVIITRIPEEIESRSAAYIAAYKSTAMFAVSAVMVAKEIWFVKEVADGAATVDVLTKWQKIKETGVAGAKWVGNTAATLGPAAYNNYLHWQYEKEAAVAGLGAHIQYEQVPGSKIFYTVVADNYDRKRGVELRVISKDTPDGPQTPEFSSYVISKTDYEKLLEEWQKRQKRATASSNASGR
jgi:hypothetical protein